MSDLLIDLCLRAYPRPARDRDGELLRDLALELGADHGAVREAFGLLRGGLAQRWRHTRPRQRAMLAVGGAGLAVALLAGPAVAAPIRVEEEITTCSADPCS